MNLGDTIALESNFLAMLAPIQHDVRLFVLNDLSSLESKNAERVISATGVCCKKRSDVVIQMCNHDFSLACIACRPFVSNYLEVTAEYCQTKTLRILHEVVRTSEASDILLTK